MLRNLLKPVFRYLVREKTNTIINILGLTLGITGSLVLFLIVKHGSSYDNFHTKRDRIYRLVTKSKGNTGDTFTQGIPPALPEAFRNDFKEVEEVAFTSYRRGSLISVRQKNGELKKYEEPKGVAVTQSSFFTIFDRKILTGSGSELDKPNQAIISEKFALKYFESTDVLGQTVEYENNPYVIAAVMEDYPSNTDLPFDLILSYATVKRSLDEAGWGGISDSDNCYFLLKENQSTETINAVMALFVKKHLGDGQEEVNNTFLPQPLKDLHSDMRYGNYNAKMPKEAFITFSLIGIFLLVTACINFINLSTAEAIKRTKQVGIRKILGSSRSELITQFLGESFIITLVAVLLSLLMAQIALSFINPLMEISLKLSLNSDVMVWIFLVVVAIGVTLASGLYPAFTMSNFKPALALKNQVNSNRSSGNTLRKGLVVMQFFISQFFIIGTIVISRQMDFMQQQDLGFERDAIVAIPFPNNADTVRENNARKLRTLKQEISQLPGVEQVSLNYAPPSFKAVLGTEFKLEGNDQSFQTQVKQVDGDYISLYGMDIIAGQSLADADTMNSVVVNEKLVKMAGLTNPEIIGKELLFWGKRLPVTGVVKDFNTTSLSRPIEPVVMLNNMDGYQSLSVKLNPVNMQNTVSLVQTKWEAAYPEYIFKYDFIDEQIRQLYKGEGKMTRLLRVFSFIAIFIGCLGLYGLVAFTTNQKTKEVGVRKVLGASVQSIVLLFSKDFVKLIVIGFVLAAPVAGFIMSKLLEQFAYKIELGPAIFVTSLGLTFLIAFITVGFRSVKAAMVNPVHSLRSE